jgi:hypothetical protein
LDHHLKCLAAGGLEGIVADYSSDDVIITPPGHFSPDGILRGRAGAEQGFRSLLRELGEPGASFQMDHISVESDYAYIVWRAETRLAIAARFQVRGGRAFARGLDQTAPRRDAALIRALGRAHDLLSDRCGSGFGLPERAYLTQAPANPYERKLLRLAFLAPDLQRDIIAGRQPVELNLERLMAIEIPANWAAQRALFARLR